MHLHLAVGKYGLRMYGWPAVNAHTLETGGIVAAVHAMSVGMVEDGACCVVSLVLPQGKWSMVGTGCFGAGAWHSLLLLQLSQDRR